MGSRASLAAAALLLAVFSSFQIPVSCAPKSVDLTTLILSVPGWQNYDHAETVLRGFGAAYEIKVLQSSDFEALDVTKFLTNADGSGKYGFIIVTPANVINIWGGVLSLNQINQLYAYQEAFGVRLALEAPYVPSFGSDIPGGPPGLAVAHVDDNTPAPGVVTAKVSATAPLTTSGIKAAAPMDLTGLYTTPVKITNTSRSTPVLDVVTPSAYAAGYAAVVTKFDTGREQFTTFFPCAGFSADCLLTAHLYYNWGMHGILPGARDALFSIQVDDLFLKTEEPFDHSKSYRMTKSDAAALAAFQTSVPGMPAGSNFKVEFVSNNGGYIELTQEEAYYEVWTNDQPADVSPIYQKPPGTGVDLMPSNPDVSWWKPATWKANDPLYAEMGFGASGKQFYMGHHTFSHEVLNAVTYNDAYQQIRLNQAAAAPWNTTNGSFNRFSQSAMVTPGISGLRNKDALRALQDCGITAAVGDTSWPHLRNQQNPWQAQVLSAAANGTVDGFYILPRSPTEVYYDVSTEAVEEQLYNWFYCCNSTANANCPTDSCEAGKPFTRPQKWADILAREQTRVLRLLLALRPDGHMFHQGNVRQAAGTSNQSLLAQWVAKMVAAYSSKVTWPLVTLKLDEQLDFAKARIKRDACGLKYSLTFDDATKAASSLRISSATGGCEAPVMIDSAAVTGANPNPRILGAEPRLYTATVAAGSSKTLTLGSGIKWS